MRRSKNLPHSCVGSVKAKQPKQTPESVDEQWLISTCKLISRQVSPRWRSAAQDELWGQAWIIAQSELEKFNGYEIKGYLRFRIYHRLLDYVRKLRKHDGIQLQHEPIVENEDIHNFESYEFVMKHVSKETSNPTLRQAVTLHLLGIPAKDLANQLGHTRNRISVITIRTRKRMERTYARHEHPNC